MQLPVNGFGGEHDYLEGLGFFLCSDDAIALMHRTQDLPSGVLGWARI